MGNGLLDSAGVLASVRLFVSPVKPSLTHFGAAELVPFRAVCASSVLAVPRKASPPQASPNTPHSVVFQFGARSTLLSGPVTRVAFPEPTDKDTPSFPPLAALP
jgi:hypothetical protein